MSGDPQADLAALQATASELAEMIRRQGPGTEECAGFAASLTAIALLVRTLLHEHAHAAWRGDVRLRSVLDDLVDRVTRSGPWERNLTHLEIPHPARGGDNPWLMKARYRDLVQRLGMLRERLRPTAHIDEVLALAWRCPGLHLVTETSTSDGGAGGSRLAADRTLVAITPGYGPARTLAEDLRRQRKPSLGQRALCREVLDWACGEVVSALDSVFDAVPWPAEGWIGATGFVRWCQHAGVDPDQAADQLKEAAYDWSTSAHTGPVFAEIRVTGQDGHDNRGWSLGFEVAWGFRWEECDWND